MFRRVEAVARESGLAIDFSKVRRHASTLRAHTLLRHAKERGTQWALGQAFFQAYFERGQDVGAMDVLVALGEGHGFERTEVIDLCETPAELEKTRELARPPGITGVPFTLIGRADAKATGAPRFAVNGAQPVSVFRAAIERALAAD
jgi:predicted DsbA family dithiol-disulfide isomerase